jgi:SWI/SNF-related matrix-associated actin-dependent regulator of chromatin subfamily A3
MSAKRRQEAIERFNVPLEDNEAGSSLGERVPTTRSRLRPKTSSNSVGDDDSHVNSTDDDFIDDDDNGSASIRKRKGKGKANTNTHGENPRVMLLSLKCGSLGLNLTVANNVYL